MITKDAFWWALYFNRRMSQQCCHGNVPTHKLVSKVKIWLVFFLGGGGGGGGGGGLVCGRIERVPRYV